MTVQFGNAFGNVAWNSQQLCSWKPLTQVIFVFDYIQLVFEDCSLNIYNSSQIVNKDSKTYHSDTALFPYLLKSLIGSSINSIEFKAKAAFSLNFSNHYKLEILLNDESVNGPEAFEIADNNTDLIIIEQN